jgi:hypothetical protein
MPRKYDEDGSLKKKKRSSSNKIKQIRTNSSDSAANNSIQT